MKNAHAFFELQARDALDWLQAGGVQIGPETRMLDLAAAMDIPASFAARRRSGGLRRF